MYFGKVALKGRSNAEAVHKETEVLDMKEDTSKLNTVADLHSSGILELSTKESPTIDDSSKFQM